MSATIPSPSSATTTTNSVFSLCTTLGAGFTAYVSMVYLLRYRSWHRLEAQPSPTTADEAYPILYNFFALDYPLFTTSSLEIGFLKTYGIPTISTILVKTGELTDNTTKRIDDTYLIMREILENPPSSERSLNAIRRMNVLHSKYRKITNSDYLYVLAIFICEPMRLAEQYGYRGVHPHEKKSSFLMFQHIGREMGIRGIFASYEEAEAFMMEYERKYMRFSPKNTAIAEATISVVLGLFPSCLHGAIKQVLYTLSGPTLRMAMNFPTPSATVEALVHGALTVSKYVVKLLLPPRTRFNSKRRTNTNFRVCPFGSSVGYASEQCTVMVGAPYFNPYSAPAYPVGYSVEDLGPTKFAGQLGRLHSEM